MTILDDHAMFSLCVSVHRGAGVSLGVDIIHQVSLLEGYPLIWLSCNYEGGTPLVHGCLLL